MNAEITLLDAAAQAQWLYSRIILVVQQGLIGRTLRARAAIGLPKLILLRRNLLVDQVWYLV